MTDADLDRVAEWARDRIHAGQEPPWSYYKLMQLIDAVEGLKNDCPLILRTEDLPRAADTPESGPQLSGQVVALDSIRPRPPQTPALPQS